MCSVIKFKLFSLLPIRVLKAQSDHRSRHEGQCWKSAVPGTNNRDSKLMITYEFFHHSNAGKLFYSKEISMFSE